MYCDLISIVIPVYNVEHYLERCLESVINQTYKNIEIILVDDGSTDNSGNLCDIYAKKDLRIKVYHKDNGGLSDARNYGISMSNGKYISFIDSDDYVASDMIEALYKALCQHKTDISICRPFDVYENGNLSRLDEKKENSSNFITISNVQAMKLVLEAKVISVQAWGKLYKKEIFDNINFPKNKIAEDAFIILKVLNSVKNVCYTRSEKYFYVHRPGSITTRKFNSNSLNVIEAYTKNYKFIKKHYPSLLYQAKTRVCWSYFYVLDRYLIADDVHDEELEKKLIRFFKHNKLFVLTNRLFTFKRRLAFLTLLVNKNLYKGLVKKLICFY